MLGGTISLFLSQVIPGYLEEPELTLCNHLASSVCLPTHSPVFLPHPICLLQQTPSIVVPLLPYLWAGPSTTSRGLLPWGDADTPHTGMPKIPATSSRPHGEKALAFSGTTEADSRHLVWLLVCPSTSPTNFSTVQKQTLPGVPIAGKISHCSQQGWKQMRLTHNSSGHAGQREDIPGASGSGDQVALYYKTSLDLFYTRTLTFKTKIHSWSNTWQHKATQHEIEKYVPH